MPLLAYAAIAAWFWSRDGIPVLDDTMLPWLLGFMLACSVTDLRRFARGVVVEWLPFIGALTLYDLLRGIADGRLLPAHAHPQMWVDKYVFGFGTVPTVWLQDHLWDPSHLHWYDYASWAVYMTHFFTTPILAVVLWLKAPAAFRRYAVLVVVVSFAGMVTYVLYPAMPPWLASSTHVIPQVTRITAVVSEHFHFLDGRALFEHGAAWSNEIAAMPSLHEALALLFSITLWPFAGRFWRVVLVLYPLAMAFALVYTAEHYVIEVVLGAGYTLAVRWAVDRYEPELLVRLRLLRLRTAALAMATLGRS